MSNNSNTNNDLIKSACEKYYNLTKEKIIDLESLDHFDYRKFALLHCMIKNIFKILDKHNDNLRKRRLQQIENDNRKVKKFKPS